jgi:hypothetical protein
MRRRISGDLGVLFLKVAGVILILVVIALVLVLVVPAYIGAFLWWISHPTQASTAIPLEPQPK